MKRVYSLIIAAIILVGIWLIISREKSTEETAFMSNEPTNVIVYACADNMSIEASYFQPLETVSGVAGKLTGSVKLKLSDGRNLDLTQIVSADGVRYANADESFVFWAKGNGSLVLENTTEKNFIGCIRAPGKPAGSNLDQIYVNSESGFALRLPVIPTTASIAASSTASTTYQIDEDFVYQASPTRLFHGVKFTIPTTVASGTNLSNDSYISFESIPNTFSCSADLFFDGTHTTTKVTENSITYSKVSTSNAGAGNRYEETIYAIPGTNPCLAFRYFIHYTALENYPAGTRKRFDKAALLREFDAIRSTLIVR